ncbi:MAG: hypothetical protein KDB80_08560 [Planctomycetes bacterium]|nr:hypothetical protein [Planctomycetota bacterium]
MRKPLHERIPLLPGKHPTREHGMCAMELVAWLAGEEHTDQPECTCPVLGSVVRTFNDVVPDTDTRNRYVRPLVPRLIHTVADEATQRRRAFLALDTAVRFFAAMSLAAAGKIDAAESINALPEVTDEATAADAAAALERHGRTVHAAWWTAARAAEGHRVELWIGGVVHAARATRTWQGMRRLVESMIDLGVEIRR